MSPGELGAASLAAIEKQTADVLNLDSSQLRQLTDDIWAEYLGTLDEQLAGYFASLRPRYQTGILSNSMVGAREREQAAYGLGDLCDVLVYSHEEGMAKPEPRFYRLVCDRLDVFPGETIFLDDTLQHVEGARAVGMHALRFTSTKRDIKELSLTMKRAC